MKLRMLRGGGDGARRALPREVVFVWGSSSVGGTRTCVMRRSSSTTKASSKHHFFFLRRLLLLLLLRRTGFSPPLGRSRGDAVRAGLLSSLLLLCEQPATRHHNSPAAAW